MRRCLAGRPVVMETVCCHEFPENTRRHLHTELLKVMARSERDVIDFSALERELQGAIEAEQRYKRENEAKLNAVHQGVSYDQFRGLVLSSHLKPLEKKDKDRALPRQPWNSVAPSNT